MITGTYLINPGTLIYYNLLFSSGNPDGLTRVPSFRTVSEESETYSLALSSVILVVTPNLKMDLYRDSPFPEVNALRNWHKIKQILSSADLKKFGLPPNPDSREADSHVWFLQRYRHHSVLQNCKVFFGLNSI